MKLKLFLVSLVLLSFYGLSVWWSVEPKCFSVAQTKKPTVVEDTIEVTFKEFQPVQLNSKSIPQNPIYAVYSPSRTTSLVIEGCEYMKNLGGGVNGYVHKGNCKNPIHPENTVDWVKFNKLLNSPILKNIL